MSVPRAATTVTDLLRFALPVGTRIVAGRPGLARPVTWTSVLHARPPAFPSLEGRELAILSIEALHLLSDKLTLADIINDLAHMDVAAIAVIGAVDATACQAAETHAIPLLNLPDGLSMRQVERDVIRVLVGPPPLAEARGQEVYTQLLQLSTENRGMRALLEALADLTGRTVAVQDKRLEVLSAAGPLAGAGDWPALEAALASEEPLPAHFRDRVEVALHTPEPVEIEMPDAGARRLVMPIIANRMGRGFFSLLADVGAFDALDWQFVRHGAAVCAIEMAKEKAVREAQKRVQGSVIERLLQGTLSGDQAIRHLTRLGHHTEGRRYAALAASWLEQGPSERRLESILNDELRAFGYEALVQPVDDAVVVFCAIEGEGDSGSRKTIPRAIRQLAESSMLRVRSADAGAEIAIGIGRPVDRLADWRVSYQEAAAALNVAVQWQVGQPLYFANLGVYQLLSLLLPTPELRAFLRETLGGLAEDSPANAEFVSTLEAFFDAHGNLSQTAGRLHVHRNTLQYRMERIAQIGDFNLDDPETRLAVHLALKIRRLLTGERRASR